jgi:hypothetical protein
MHPEEKRLIRRFRRVTQIESGMYPAGSWLFVARVFNPWTLEIEHPIRVRSGKSSIVTGFAGLTPTGDSAASPHGLQTRATKNACILSAKICAICGFIPSIERRTTSHR